MRHGSSREGRTAAAGARRVRIDEVESLPDQRFLEVQRHAVKIDERLGIDKDAHAVEFEDAIALTRMAVELHDIGQAGTSSAGYAETKTAFLSRDAFLGHRNANALDCAFRYMQAF